MPVKNDRRVITHATPPLVTVTKRAGMAELNLHMRTARCEYSGNDGESCSSNGEATVSRTIETDEGVRIQRLCLHHLSNPPEKREKVDIDALMAEIDTLLYTTKDQSTWNWKWEG